MRIKLPKTDRILGVSAMIISMLTLIIFIQQTNIINEQSKLSVKPHLSFHLTQFGNDSIITFTQTVKNKGLGPAIIKDAHILYKAEKQPFYFDLFIYDTYPDFETYASLLGTTSLSNYSIISPDESLVIYNIEVPTHKLSEFLNYIEVDENEVDGSPKWNFEISYSSMYEDDVWTIDDINNFPKKDN